MVVLHLLVLSSVLMAIAAWPGWALWLASIPLPLPLLTGIRLRSVSGLVLSFIAIGGVGTWGLVVALLTGFGGDWC